MKDEKKITLVLGSHAHVPSGASDSYFEYIYENRLRPFVTNLYRYSNIHAVLHYSGVLLYWIERTHQEFFMLIEGMAARKQIEIMGGGFYEPMFPLIPLQDRIGQIEFMTTYLRKHFGKRPQGCWIPGMVWEQHLANALSSSDMTYSFLSQDQFTLAGVKEADLYSPCISEDQGKIITIFPVSLSIEKDLAEKSFSHVFTELKKKFDENYDISDGKIVAVFPDKISSSPEEAEDTAWNRFFEEISLSENIVETVLPQKIIRSHKFYHKASFPNSSSLPAAQEQNEDENISYINDFSPRRFIIEHEQANGIYSKMIFTNVLINQLKGDKSRKLNAREELWKAQDSSLFMPGSGLFKNELRKAAYSSLLRAEMLSREKGKTNFSLIQYDFDFDGVKEYLFQDMIINCYIRQKGASVFELDYMPKEWNYLDCGSSVLSARTAFADIICPADVKIDALASCKPESLKKSRQCFNELYDSIAQDKKGKSCFKLSAVTDETPFGSIEIIKCFLLKRNNITVSYTLKNTSKDIQNFQFLPEINFSFAGASDDHVRFYSIDNAGKDVPVEKYLDTSNLKILDVNNEVQITLASVKNFSGCLVPVFFNDIYQSSRILPVFSVSLGAGELWTNEFTVKFSH